MIKSKGEKEDRIQVTRGADRTWAMYYLTTGQSFTASLANLKGPLLNAWWFNPRDGKAYDSAGTVTDRPFAQVRITETRREFRPPGESGQGNDWVLVLDDANRNYPPPAGSAPCAVP